MDSSQTILVVDDDPDALGFAVRTLEQQGYTVWQAGAWTEAVDAVQQGRPDLALVDLDLPGIRGDALLEFIREQHKDLPVVIASPEIDGPAMEALGKLGARGFIRKPYQTDDLLVVVEQVFLEQMVAAPAPAPTSGARAHVAPGKGVGALEQERRPVVQPMPTRERRFRKRRPGVGRRIQNYVMIGVLFVAIGLAFWFIQQSFTGGFLGIGVTQEPAPE